MNATGTLYMSKQRPTTGAEANGAFRLELVLVDNMGRNPHTGKDEKEAYRVRWAGPAAQAFWQAHGSDLTAGTPLHADIERLRAHTAANVFPPTPELRGRVVRLALAPRRAQANSSEQAATTA